MTTSSSQVREQARRNTRARFEQWAQNPTCQANTVSAVHNIRMVDVAAAEGTPTTFGQSPFAIARGETFERSLFWNDATLIREALVERAVLPPEATGFADLRIAMNRGPVPTLDRAIEMTADLVDRVGSGRSDQPSIVAGAAIRIPKGVMLPEAVLILDILVVRTDTPIPELVVGEVKTYPDRGGHTAPRELAVARAQAGLYVHALELLVEHLGLAEDLIVRQDGFLVLTRPGSNRPSIRADEDLRFQAERARRGFELLEAAALGLPPFSALGGDPVDSVLRAATDYSEACLSFCDRAAACHDDALAAGDPAVLGDNVRRFLGTVDLHRTLALLDGSPTVSEAEADLVRRIGESDWMATR